MNTRYVICLLCCVFITPLLTAQEDEADEKIFVLSPFTVQEDEAQGYQALSTLAGTRIKTPLRDVGAAISVFTPEFMEDTGATDASTLLSYGLNTEVSGEQGNFAGGIDTDANREEPQNNAQRVRGLAAASLTRGFFLTDIPFDSYNTTSVTINRGPNSLLFGVGSPGGIIDNAVKQATVGGNFGELSVRFGEHGSHRQTIDYNAVLIEDRLAVRIAALNEDTKFHQRPAYEEERRIHAAFEAILFENEGSEVFGRTTLRANIEDGQIEGTPVNVVPPKDSFSDWFSITTDRSIESITGQTLPGWVDNSNDANGLFSPKTIINTLPGAPRFQNGFPNYPASFVNLPITWSNTGSSIPTQGVAGQPNVAGIITNVLWQRTDNPRGRFEMPHSASIFSDRAGNWTPGFTPPVVLDKNVLNNEELLVFGTTDFVSHEFDAKNFALEQVLFGGKGGVELAYDSQNYYRYAVLPWDHSNGQPTSLRVDVSSHLANDQPNPNVGRINAVSRYVDPQERTTSRETYRATAFYELDFTEEDGFLGMLGRHTFTGLWNEQTIDTLSENNGLFWESVDAFKTADDIFTGIIGTNRPKVTLYAYLTPSLLGSEYGSASDVRITQATNAYIPQNGEVFFGGWNDHPVPILNPDGVPEGATIENYVPGSGDPLFYNNFRVNDALVSARRNEQVITSEALSWQSKWWNDNIIGLIGWRTDESINTGQASTARLPDGSADPLQRELGTSSEITKGSTRTNSVVVHVPDELIDLGSTNVSFHWNESENFSPESTRRDIRGRVIPSPTGTTEEYGVGFEFLDGAISLRISNYEMTSEGADAGLTGVANTLLDTSGVVQWGTVESQGDAFEDIIAQATDPDRFPGAGSFNSYSAVQQAIGSLLPPDISTLINRRFDPALPAEAATFFRDPIVGLTTTRSFVSEGTEIELVGNLSDSWRVSLNVGQQETVTSNSAPELTEVAEFYRQQLVDSGLWGLQWAPDNDAPPTFGSRFNERIGIPITAAKTKDDTVSLEQREWRVNLATNYNFREGALKGFGVGGAYRYQSKVATGYELRLNEDGVQQPVLDRPFFGPAEWNMDLWASYTRKLTDKIDWKIQLNIRNALGDDDYIPVVTNPDGRVAVVRNANPTDIYLTNTFKF